jgi:hypothetical protein
MTISDKKRTRFEGIGKLFTIRRMLVLAPSITAGANRVRD